MGREKQIPSIGEVAGPGAAQAGECERCDRLLSDTTWLDSSEVSVFVWIWLNDWNCMTNFSDYRDCTGSRADRFFKSTLFSSSRLLLGLNCLEPGQVQAVHSHDGQDKFYFVLEGEGEFVVGDETRTVGTGFTVWAPAGMDHGVINKGQARLVLLVGLAPSPG